VKLRVSQCRKYKNGFRAHFITLLPVRTRFTSGPDRNISNILGPNGWPRFNNNQFKYLAEIVEHKLVFDGDFDTYRFTIKFQSNQGSEYALTFDPQTELYRAGIHGPNRSEILKILLVLVQSGPRI